MSYFSGARELTFQLEELEKSAETSSSESTLLNAFHRGPLDHTCRCRD